MSEEIRAFTEETRRQITSPNQFLQEVAIVQSVSFSKLCALQKVLLFVRIHSPAASDEVEWKQWMRYVLTLVLFICNQRSGQIFKK